MLNRNHSLLAFGLWYSR